MASRPFSALAAAAVGDCARGGGGRRKERIGVVCAGGAVSMLLLPWVPWAMLCYKNFFLRFGQNFDSRSNIRSRLIFVLCCRISVCLSTSDSCNEVVFWRGNFSLRKTRE